MLALDRGTDPRRNSVRSGVLMLRCTRATRGSLSVSLWTPLTRNFHTHKHTTFYRFPIGYDGDGNTGVKNSAWLYDSLRMFCLRRCCDRDAGATNSAGGCKDHHGARACVNFFYSCYSFLKSTLGVL